MWRDVRSVDSLDDVLRHRIAVDEECGFGKDHCDVCNECMSCL